jgi:CheY-like chemotaxis protein
MAYKLFLIDDDADDRELFREALYMIDPNIICHTAMDGRKALAMLASGIVPLPNIIFLDINMPGMTGWECLDILKGGDRYRDIPVIIYSTSSYAEDIEKAHRGGALCFYIKPVRFVDLVDSLQLVINYLADGAIPFPGEASDFFIVPSSTA